MATATGDVSQHSVTWTDLLAEPGQTTPVNNRVFPTYHKGISAAINVLNNYYPEVTTLSSPKFWSLLYDYTAMHTPKWKVMSSSSTFFSNLSNSSVSQYLMDGLGELWVAENGCEDERWTPKRGRTDTLGGPAWTDTPTNGYHCK